MLRILCLAVWASLCLAEYPASYTSINGTERLKTNLDDNLICYLHMYGLRINARRRERPYCYGYLPREGSEVLFLVTTVSNNITLASQSEFELATRNSDHSPAYNPSIDYCANATKALQERISKYGHRQTSPLALKYRRCAENACAPHGHSSDYGEAYKKVMLWDEENSLLLECGAFIFSTCHIAQYAGLSDRKAPVT